MQQKATVMRARSGYSGRLEGRRLLPQLCRLLGVSDDLFDRRVLPDEPEERMQWPSHEFGTDLASHNP